MNRVTLNVEMNGIDLKISAKKNKLIIQVETQILFILMKTKALRKKTLFFRNFCFHASNPVANLLEVI